MAINRIEINDFLVFKGNFSLDFNPGVNVIIGANATGKTTLLKSLYGIINKKIVNCFINNMKYGVVIGNGRIELFYDINSSILFNQIHFEENNFLNNHLTDKTNDKLNMLDINYILTGNDFKQQSVFIPEKDMLSHSKGLLALKLERFGVPFDDTLTDIIVKSQLYPKRNILNNNLCAKIQTIIGGEVVYDNDEFFILKDINNKLISFSMEASGYKKLGLLWKLISNGLLDNKSVLFWDEPENSLNPDLVPVLVDILLELSRNGVQIFIATHNEILASYFAVNRKKSDNVMFISLYKQGEHIKSDVNDRFDLLRPNNITAEQIKLYEKEIEKGLGGND